MAVAYDVERRRYLNLEARLQAEQHGATSPMTHRLYGGTWLKIEYGLDCEEYPFMLAAIGTEEDSIAWHDTPCIGYVFEDGTVISRHPDAYTEAECRLIVAALRGAENNP